MTSPGGSTINRNPGSKGQVYLEPYGWVQPIRDQRGNLLYYSDPVTGQRLNLGTAGPGAGQKTSATEARKQAEARAERRGDPGSKAAAAAAEERIWLDGQLVTVKRNADGTWTTKGVGGESTVVPPTAFDALDGNAVDPTAPFLMGMRVGTGTPTKRGDITGMLKNLGTINQNMMTVGGAASWFASLSTKDPGAYQAMLDKLLAAGYLSKGDYAAAAGKWSSAAGTALTLAARDVAVVNTTAEGRTTTLDMFLSGKQGVAAALDAASGGGRAAYTPVTRAYTDPESLKAAAKSTAEDILGRQLNDEEEAKLTSRFRALEDQKYDAMDAAGRSGQGGGSYTDPGSGQVDAFVEENDQEAANFRAAEYGQALKRLFGVATGG